MKRLARALRKNQTDAERFLWSRLRDRRFSGYKFRRQYVTGPYIVDFVCLEKRLIIEIDGGQHAVQVQPDAERKAYLETSGFKVLRFWNNEVFKETEGVLAVILQHLQARSLPGPAWTGGRPELRPAGGEGR